LVSPIFFHFQIIYANNTNTVSAHTYTHTTYTLLYKLTTHNQVHSLMLYILKHTLQQFKQWSFTSRILPCKLPRSTFQSVHPPMKASFQLFHINFNIIPSCCLTHSTRFNPSSIMSKSSHLILHNCLTGVMPIAITLATCDNCKHDTATLTKFPSPTMLVPLCEGVLTTTPL